MSNYQKYIENELFNERYIKPNIAWHSSYLSGKRGFLRIFKLPYAALMKKFFLKSYFQKRVLKGKVDIPYLELVLTTKCTMRCVSCNNLMQYFQPTNQYAATLDGLKNALEALFERVDSVQRLRIIGGEPLLFQPLPELVEFLNQQKQIKTFTLVSNGTIDFSTELLKALSKAKKLRKITISDYSLSPNLKLNLQHKSIFTNLKKYKIAYSLDSSGADAKWSDPGKIYKRGRSKKDIIKNFIACKMPCVSLMSAEGVRADEGKFLKNASKGAVFVCPVASSLSRLKGLGEFKGDFINLEDKKERFFSFYAQDFFKACDYCHDMDAPKKAINVAVQTAEPLTLEP